jgi:hypothetical protein
MNRPTSKTLTICVGVGVLAAAAVAIPAWAKPGEGASEEAGTVERADQPPFPSGLGAAGRSEFRQELEAFRDCMAEQGVDLPVPPEGGHGFVIPAPPPARGEHEEAIRKRLERARRQRLSPPALPSDEDLDALEQAREECGAPPLPPPLFAGRLRGDVHECLAKPLPRRHHR